MVIFNVAAGAPPAGPGVVYSFEERRVGTWIDGKAIYQRTWETVTGNIKVWVTVSEASNVDSLVDGKCEILLAGKKDQAVGPASHVNLWFFSEKLQIWVNEGTVAQKPAYATYWYTKKDDSLDVNGNPL